MSSSVAVCTGAATALRLMLAPGSGVAEMMTIGNLGVLGAVRRRAPEQALRMRKETGLFSLWIDSRGGYL